MIAKTPKLDAINQGIRPKKVQVNSIIENKIVIYPNPVSNQLTIKLPSIYKENPTQIELYNSIGQLVLSKSYEETTIEVSVSSYPKGLYILKIQNGEEMKTEKIIIE
ncbi:T9SS type A sorting domain-containing protein [Bernardetia litoralis]|uniref:T9SS type A sorting domain-containing protein n=1 Tax=Bernardetia litoralis TaxID=999 RepID=UPI0009D9DE5E